MKAFRRWIGVHYAEAVQEHIAIFALRGSASIPQTGDGPSVGAGVASRSIGYSRGRT
jgi:hypothetical protein